ncbi:MAG: hypothetical protein ACXV2D_08040 [Halobacteriota archaeon]
MQRGVGAGVDWSHYKHLLPEHVYDVYMKRWADVSFSLYSAQDEAQVTPTFIANQRIVGRFECIDSEEPAVKDEDI